MRKLRLEFRGAGKATALGCVLALLPILSSPVTAQQFEDPSTARLSGKFKTTYVRVDPADEGLLYEPTNSSTLQPRIALLFSHPSGDNFVNPIGPQLASYGYRALLVNQHGSRGNLEQPLPGISNSIKYLRTLPGVERVIYVGWSGGGVAAAFYTNVAENGAKACQGPEKIYSCIGTGLNGLAKPDGLILLDTNLGAPYKIEAIDPAVSEDGRTRDPSLDMFSAANGFDAAGKKGTYTPEFAKRFYAAQKARTDRLIAAAMVRLKALESGTSTYSDDEPFVVRGAKSSQSAATLHSPDPTHYLARTRKPHLLLKSDGTDAEVVVQTVRPPSTKYSVDLKSLDAWTLNTTVRDFLAQMATRTTPDYHITADDIVGVDWRSSMNSTAGNAEGITIPTLVMVMTCNDHIVHGEIIFDHLAAKDKTFAGVEGATHAWIPCKAEWGDTEKRLFDFVDRWLEKPGRF